MTTPCATCSTVDDLIKRVSKILSDDGGVDDRTWTQGELVGHLNEALCELLKLRPDVFMERVDLPLKPGSRQQIPEGYAALVRIDTNQDADSSGALQEGAVISEADSRYAGALKKKLCLSSDLCAEPRPYVVSSYTRDGISSQTFTVYPPVPQGASVVVSAQVVARPPRHTTAAMGACLGVPCEYEASVVDWILHRAYAKEIESQYAGAMVDRHRKAWFEGINAKYLQDSRFNSGFWAGLDQNNPAADPNFRQH